jgi:Xaa-Pro aminopeptidase
VILKKATRRYFSSPRFPDFPYSEWRTRITTVQEHMTDNGVDCLVLWQKENLRYFFGFMTIHWYLKSLQPAVGIIPVKGEPILIVPELFQGNTEGLCWVTDFWTQANTQRPEAQRELPEGVAEVIKEIGFGKKRIALEMGSLGCLWIPRPLNDIDTFRKALPEARFVDGDQVIWGCRMIKSPLEVDRITKSIHKITAVELAIVEGYRPGMTEVDLMRVVNRARAEQGGNTTGDDAIAAEHFICSSEKWPFADIKALEGAMITRDDAIQFVSSFYHMGYTPDSTRRWQVGPVTKEVERRFELLWAGQDKVEAMLKPGVKAKEVYEAMYQPITSLPSPPVGFVHSGHAGHGVGLDLQEPPSIDAWNENIIQEGMVLSVEPWLNQEKGSFFGIGDTFVVTDKGCTKIEGLGRNIIQVSHPWQE